MHENRETSSSTARQTGSPAGKGDSRTTGMNGGEESDGVVVPVKSSNQATEQQAGAAERAEGRTPTEENTSQGRTLPAQDGKGVSQGLAGVRKVARERRQERFTTLLHHVTIDLLRQSYLHLQKKAAPGVDGVTWRQYEEGLEGRLADLKDRIHRGAYRAQASRRIYIPKADGRERPIGIAALEDKIVQQAVVTILNQIYEVDFRAIQLRVSTGAQPASGAGRAECGDSAEAGELDSGRGHSRLFRPDEPRMDDAICPTPGRRPADSAPDPEVVEGGSKRGRRVVGDEGRDSARSGDFAATGQRVPALRLRVCGWKHGGRKWRRVT